MRRLRGALVLGAALLAGGLAFVSREHPAPAQATPAAQPASPEQNKAVARRVFDDLFTGGHYEALDQIYDKSCTVHFGNRTQPIDQSVAEGKGWRTAAPDLVMTADQVTADGDTVTVSWTAKATHTGQSFGMKPTGKRIVMHGTSKFRLVNGKIVEVWNSEYRDDLFKQLGVPKPAALLYEEVEDVRWGLYRMFSRSSQG
jgi:predicted ester cyclase